MLNTIPSEGIHSVGGGYFMVNGAKMSFEDLVMMVQMKNVETADKVFAGRFSEIEERNKKIQLVNDVMQMLRKYQGRFDKDGNISKTHQFVDVNSKIGKLDDADKALFDRFVKEINDLGIVKGYDEWSGKGLIWSHFEAKPPIYTFDKKALEVVLDNCRGGLDNLNSQNELDMMKLNKLGNQRSSYVQLLSSMLSTIKEARSAAVR